MGVVCGPYLALGAAPASESEVKSKEVRITAMFNRIVFFIFPWLLHDARLKGQEDVLFDCFQILSFAVLNLVKVKRFLR